jgi:hypothetical protein
MACDISLGRVTPCKDSVGGLDAIYLINESELSYDNLTFDALMTDSIEGVTGTPTAYKWELKGTSTFTQNIVSSRENGTTYFEQVLELTFTRMDAYTHREIKLLSYGNPKVIVKDNNGNFFLVGAKHGADVTGGTIVTGGNMGDLNGYTLTLTAMEQEPAYFFEATTEAGLTSAGFTIVSGIAS